MCSQFRGVYLTLLRQLTALTAIALLWLVPDSTARTVEEIRFTGDFKTQEWVLRNEIDLTEGSEFDPETWTLDRKRLATLSIFSKVESDTHHTSTGLVIEYKLDEVWTLIPLLNIGGEIDNLDIDVGILDKNFLGTYIEPGFIYSYFEERSSYSWWLNMPRLLSRYYSVSLSFARTHSREPADRLGERYAFEYERKRTVAATGAQRRFSEMFLAGLGFQYSKENYTLLPDTLEPINLEPKRDQVKLKYSAGVTFGRIYYDNFFFDGQELAIIGELFSYDRDDYHPKFFNVYFQFSSFENLNDRFNFCNRFFFGTSKTAEVLPLYAVSGSSNIRGEEDRISRGSKMYYSNNEIRMRAIQNGWLHSQLAAFVDFGYAWSKKYSVTDLIERSYLTYGIGARLALVRFYNAIGRADVAFNTRTGEFTYYISAGQFF